MLKLRVDWTAIGLGLGVLALVFWVFAQRPPQVVALEEAVFDEYQRWNPRPYNPDSPVRVIDIDEESLRQLGQWPWPRTFLAEMVYRLTNAGAAAIAFDMTFAEQDRTSPLVMARSLRRFGDDYGGLFDAMDVPGVQDTVPDHDASFGFMISQTPVVLGVVAGDDFVSEGALAGVAGIPVSGPSDQLNHILTNFTGVLSNLDVLTEGAAGIATISLAKEEGVTIRRVPVVVTVNGQLLPALSIDALRVGQGAQSHIIKTTLGSGEAEFTGETAVTSIKTGGVVVPLDPDGTLRVRYSGAVSERVIPAHRLLEPGGLAPEIAEDVAGRILFVGSSAASLFDVKTTPLTDRISGVHVHAEIVEQIIDGAFLTRPDWGPPLERLVLGLFGLLIVLLLGTNMPLLAFGALGLGLAIIGGGSWYAFAEHATLFSPVGPMVGLALPHFAVSGYKYFTAEASRREVTRQFEHFVSPEVIEDIIDDPERYLTPGGSQRTLSIMFLDVRRFSTITEKMQPQEVIAFINKLLTPLTDAIIEHHGTIDKYMGDAVMAFWNAPRDTANHEIEAIRAMMAFNPIMKELNVEFLKSGLTDIDIGVGINTGECSVGNMGSLKRLAYSCVGDSVNLAARLEGQTKAYGVRNLIGSATAAAAEGVFAMIELDSVAVKGRTQPETIFTVVGDETVLASTAFSDLKDRLDAARAAFLAQDWDGAEAAFRQASDLGEVGALSPQALCAIMIERIDDYRINPPPADWDGVYVATSK